MSNSSEDQDSTIEPAAKAVRETSKNPGLAAPYRSSGPKVPNKYSDRADLYGDVAAKLGVSREEAKARVLGEAYRLVKLTPLEMVAQFHKKFELPGLEQGPRDLTEEEARFRINFMMEELAEYCNSMGYESIASVLLSMCEGLRKRDVTLSYRSDRRNMHEQLDALADLSYVVAGTALFHGYDLDGAFKEVHRVNMTKVRAESPDQSRRGSKYDVVKPPGFLPPDLSRFLLSRVDEEGQS